jgi:hypothetical protein
MSKTNLSLISVGAMLAFSACSSTNVSSEWDCPRQAGHGCITIEEADQIAVQRLKYKEHSSTEIVNKNETIQKNQIIEKKERKVWLAPRTDKSGNRHEASTAYYYEEISGNQATFDSSVVEPGDSEEVQ